VIRKQLYLALLVAICATDALAQRLLPPIEYKIRLATDDTTAFDVSMRIRNAPDTFRLAMAAHPEYDDRYWRYVERPTVIGMKLGASIVREDSAVWRVISHGETLIRYRIHLPQTEGSNRGSWRPFFTSTGALTGGPHSFMYVVGAERTQARVEVDVPSGWKIATSLESTSDPHVFTAPSAEALIDSPILTGNLRTWSFKTSGVPHRVVYWPLPNAAPFDTTTFVEGIRRLTQQGISLFGRAPYREYVFLIQDGSYGALEHANSVTLGARSVNLAENPNEELEEAAHEYFHLWNLVRIRPAEWKGLSFRPASETRGLWFSEGLSMFYADLLLRRAKIPMAPDSTRVVHLERLMERFLGDSGYERISPEASSLGAYRSPGSFGDNDPSVHLQGEIIGSVLDFIIRDATNGARSIDDVMRLMMQRHSGPRGFHGRDTERVVADVCRCNVTPFFEAHVRNSRPIDFNRYLRLIGMRADVKWAASANDSGRPVPDLRIAAWMPPAATHPRLLVRDANSIWAKAGLHTGDELVAVNGQRMGSWPDFRAVLRSIVIGETLRFDIIRSEKPATENVVVDGFSRPIVRITPAVNSTQKQVRLRESWLHQ
jgi:predicted metalloprotease with PDZ domain